MWISSVSGVTWSRHVPIGLLRCQNSGVCYRVVSLLSSFNDIHRMARFSVGTVPRSDLRGAQGAGPQGQTSHQLHPALHSVAVVHSRPGHVHMAYTVCKVTIRNIISSCSQEATCGICLIQTAHMRMQLPVASFQPNIGGSNISYSTTSPSSLL